MKFAKELEQDLVPEWKAKYLNYKVAQPLVASRVAPLTIP